MSVNQTSQSKAYGVGESLIRLAPKPIVAKRDPKTNDFAELGTLWVNKTSNAAWILTNVVSNTASWIAIT